MNFSVTSENKRDRRTIEQVMAESKARKKQKMDPLSSASQESDSDTSQVVLPNDETDVTITSTSSTWHLTHFLGFMLLFLYIVIGQMIGLVYRYYDMTCVQHSTEYYVS